MSQIADRYAKALFELTQEQQCLDAAQDALTQIKGLIQNLDDFRHFLDNPPIRAVRNNRSRRTGG